MLHQTFQHYDTLVNDRKSQLITDSKRLSYAHNGTLSFLNWLADVSKVTLISALVIFGCTSEYSSGPSKVTPQDDASATKPAHKEIGEASWYGSGLQGQETADGETFDKTKMTAAHPSLPMGTKAKVTNLENGKKVEVRINDRGPYTKNRVIDLSHAAAKKLDMEKDGNTQVKIETKSTLIQDPADQSGKTK